MTKAARRTKSASQSPPPLALADARQRTAEQINSRINGHAKLEVVLIVLRDDQ